jgi:hypothetical protein
MEEFKRSLAAFPLPDTTFAAAAIAAFDFVLLIAKLDRLRDLELTSAK